MPEVSMVPALGGHIDWSQAVERPESIGVAVRKTMVRMASIHRPMV